MSNIRFTSTKLVGTGKKGIIPPDEFGYREMPIGGLNVVNSAGEYYLAEGARDLFKSSSTLMRRITAGCLKGELGHPKRLPNTSIDQYLNRILTIDETNTVAHFSEIWLDEEFGKKNPQFNNKELVAIMAKVKPSGPKSSCLEESFKNPKEEVCFSIRALTRDFYHKGVNHRVLQQIVTWDNVTEPGLNIARKWHSPALESMVDCIIKPKDIEEVIDSNVYSLATEDTKSMIMEAFEISKKETLRVTNIPLLNKW